MSLRKNIDDIQFDFVKSSQRIRKLRESSKETHAALGQAIGVSEQTLKNYEQAALYGRASDNERITKIAGMSINTLCLIADHYSVSTDYLLGKSDVKSPNTDLQAVCNYTGLSQKSIEMVTHAYKWLEFENTQTYIDRVTKTEVSQNALDYLLSSENCFNLLAQICIVKKAADYVKSELDQYLAGAIPKDKEYERLMLAKKELKYTLYELSDVSCSTVDGLGIPQLEDALGNAITKIVLELGEDFRKTQEDNNHE